MCVLAVLALGAYLVIRLNVVKGLPWSVNFSVVATLIVTVAVAIFGPVRRLLEWARGTLPLSDTTLANAREDLATALAAGWAQEERVRRINDPWPLPVRWSGDISGKFDEIGEAFTGLPSRRLVILGPAGAGKTALAVKLARELLDARVPGDPVPVLLSAATWTDPSPMSEWVAAQLAIDHPGLAVRVKTGTGDIVPLARSLAASEVLPVIDGLDELPEVRRSEVVAEVNAHGSDNAVVLTCRPDEFRAATATRPIALAPVIELVPLELTDVRSYLAEATEAPLDRWQLVFDAFSADPGGPLAEVLTNPLMLWLARTVYEQGTTEPGELVDRARFSSRDAIEGHLLAGFVPAVYATRSRDRRRGLRCSPAQAQRWLGFLAAWQGRTDSADIAWWRLHLAEPGWSVAVSALRAVLYMSAAWWAMTWALTRRGYWSAGHYNGRGHFRDLLLAGPLGGAVRPLTGPLVTSRGLPPGFDQDVKHFIHIVEGVGPVRIAGAAVVLAVLGLFDADRGPDPQTPRLTFAGLRHAVLRPWAWIAAVAYLWWLSRFHREPIGVIASLWVTQLVLIWIGILTARWVLLSSLTVPVDVSSAAGPVALLRRTRWVYLLLRVAAATSIASIWLWAGATFAIADAGLTGATFVIVAILGSRGGAYPRYLEARFRLAVRRRLPWRTLSFLADAHRRGVLRQSGATYQFRHVRLQEQLAVSYSPWPPPLAPLAAHLRRRVTDVAALIEHRREQWRADTQVVTVDADGVSGVIAVRSPADSLRQEIGAYPGTLVLAAILAVFVICAGFIQWYYCPAGLVLIAMALAAYFWPRLGHYKAGLGFVPRSWSLRTSPDGIEVSQEDVTASVAKSGIQRVQVRRVRNPRGTATEWTALQVRLRPGTTVPFPTWRRWLPVVWLTTKAATGKEPQLEAALHALPEVPLAASLATQRRVTAREYSASGVLTEQPIPWTDAVLPCAAVTAALYVFRQSTLSFFCLVICLVMLTSCLYRLNVRLGTRPLPKGPWSLLITWDQIELEADGEVTWLRPEDVEEADVRALYHWRGRGLPVLTVQLRLRPGVRVPYVSADGWFPVYWKPTLDTSNIPTELIAVLHRFTGGQFGKRLAGLAKLRHISAGG